MAAPARLPAAVVPERGGPPRRRTAVGADVDLSAADADALHGLELIRGKAGGQFHDRVIEADRDTPDVAPAEAGLVGQRTHDGTGLDVVPLAHRDPVLGHVPARARRPRPVGEVPRGTVATVAPAVVLPLTPLGTLGLTHEELVRVAGLGGQCGRDVGHRDRVLGRVLLHEPAEQRDVGVVEALGDRLRELGHPHLVDVVDAGQLDLRERLPGRALDLGQQSTLAGGDEQQCVPAPAGATRAADAVDVRLGVVRDVVVDDVADTRHVEAAGGDVGRDEDVGTPVLERLDGALAEILGDVAVDRGGGEATCAQPLGEFLRRRLGPDEHDHRVEVLDLEDAGQGVELVTVVDQDVALLDGRRRRRLRGDLHLGGIGEVLLRDASDRGRHRGREQRDLGALRSVREDSLDVLLEAHREHFVRLVEDEVPQAGKIKRALLEMVDDPPGGADDDLRAPPETRELDTVGLTAVDGQDVHLGHARGIGDARLGDLERELAGRRQDEGLGALHRRVDQREDGQRERGRLAGTGLGEPDDVPSLEDERDGGRLDGGRHLVADVPDRLRDGGREPHVREGDRGVLGGSLVVGGVVAGSGGRGYGRFGSAGVGVDLVAGGGGTVLVVVVHEALHATACEVG